MDDNMEIMTIAGPGAFQFSAVPVADLEEDEYTLIVIADDVSPSTDGLRQMSCDMKKAVLAACANCPTSEKLLMRQTVFGSTIKESHGFKPLISINPSDYKPEATLGGSTCLFDATFEAIASIIDYATVLKAQNFRANGIGIIITDGMNNTGVYRQAEAIADKLAAVRGSEQLDSIKIILIGINDPKDSWTKDVEQALSDFHTKGKLDQFIPAKDATAQKLAKLAGFISQSISSQSQSLGTGGPSQNLTF